MTNIYQVRSFCYAIRNWKPRGARTIHAANVDQQVIALTKLYYCK
jgi:hypothetical protein